MGINFLILLLIVGLVILFGWLVRHAWRARNPFLKWIGAILGSLFMLVALFVGGLGLIGLIRYYNPPMSPVKEIQVEGTPEQIARVTKAFLPMKKFELAKLEEAYAGE